MPAASTNFRLEISFDDPWVASPTFTVLSELTGSDAQNRGIRKVDVATSRSGAAGGNIIGRRLAVEALNNASDWDPDNTNSVFNAGDLIRNRPLRLSVSTDGFTTQRNLFWGYVDNYLPSGTSLLGDVTFTGRDLLEMLSEYDDEFVRPAEFPGPRITGILDAFGVPNHLRGTIEHGTVPLLAETLEGDALSLLQAVRRAEYGLLYVDPDTGLIEFRNRYSILNTARWSTTQHTFDGTGAGANTPLAHRPVNRELGLLDVTRVAATGASGRTFAYDTTPADHPPITARTGPTGLATGYDADVEVAAEAWHKGWDYTGERYEAFAVRCFPSHTNALNALRAGHFELLTRVDVSLQPPNFAAPLTVDSRIEGFQLTIDEQVADAVVEVAPAATVWDTESADWARMGTAATASSVPAL